MGDSIFNYFQPVGLRLFIDRRQVVFGDLFFFLQIWIPSLFLNPSESFTQKTDSIVSMPRKSSAARKANRPTARPQRIGTRGMRVSNGIIFFSSQKSMMAFVPPFALPFSFSTRDLESSSLYAFGKMSGKIKNADFEK